MKRNLSALLVALALATGSSAALAQAKATAGIVWLSPTCPCCKEWLPHMAKNGFKLDVRHTDDLSSVRKRLGVPPNAASCHTAEIDGYAIEGHVPASDVHRLLAEKPKARGLAVPGMKLGSPGMDGPQYNGVKQAYDVVLIGADGSQSVFKSYR